MPQSTISTILNCSYLSVKIRIIYELCEGFDISLKEFFDSPYFAYVEAVDRTEKKDNKVV